jgi:hypothetical protein
MQSLIFYHKCLAALSEELKTLQYDPPTVKIVINGKEKEQTARLPIMLVLGDQQSQDIICCQMKSNKDGAGRVHRNYFCSYLSADDPTCECIGLNYSFVHDLVEKAVKPDEQLEKYIHEHDESERTIQLSYLKRQKNVLCAFE